MSCTFINMHAKQWHAWGQEPRWARDLEPGKLETCGLGLVMEPEPGQICPINQRDSLT